MPLTPNNREEHWLQGMVDGQTTLEPNKRREYWYKEIVDAIGSGGGGGGTLVVEKNLIVDHYALGETWQTIYDAAKSGKVVLLRNVYEEGGEYDVSMSYVTEVYLADGLYMVDAGNENYGATSADGYPDSSVK